MDDRELFRLFTEAEPLHIEKLDSKDEDSDFRCILAGDYSEGTLPDGLGNRLIVKIASNGFTDREHLDLWERLVREYRALGCYCPEIVRSRDGGFPELEYQGRRCLAWAEEFSKLKTADHFKNIRYPDGRYIYLDDALLMNARVASKRFDFSPLPSAYSLFDTFDTNDAEPEVMEVAHSWLMAAQALPERFRERAMELWTRWLEIHDYVKGRYDELPTALFQADINNSNVLLDEDGGFAGVMDFNIAGRDTLLNLLMREIPYVYGWPEGDDTELNPVEEARHDNDLAAQRIRYALGVVSREYRFSDAERELALPLFRCVRALWWPNRDALAKAKTPDEIAGALDEAERVLTKDFGFAVEMR